MLAASVWGWGAAAARADNTTVTLNGVDIDLGISGGLGAFAVPNAQFGAGSYDLRNVRDFEQGHRPNAGPRTNTPIWGEYFLKPEIRTTFHIDKDHEIDVNASAIYAGTLGDGDANLLSYTGGNPSSIELEEAFIGYKGPTLFGLPGDSTVVKFGRQNFSVDDGFLIADGTFDVGRRGAYYLAPRTAFDGWGVVSLNTSPIRADFFALRNSVDNGLARGNGTFAVDYPRTNFAGFDAEWYQNADTKGADGAVNYADRARYINVTYFNVYSADTNPNLFPITNFASHRDGLNVISASMGGTLIPIHALGIADNFTLYGQYVKEINNESANKVNADAWYIEPGYTFASLPWSPHLYYRYSHYSGQKDVNSTTKQSYDPLFYGTGIRSAFGTYFLGEIVGQYVTFSTNLNANQVGLQVTAPFHLLSKDDALKFDAIYYSFDFDRPAAAGATNGHLADELDLVAEYQYNANTYIAGAFGVAFPGKGGKQATTAAASAFGGAATGIGKNTYLAEIYLTRTF